MKPVGEGRSERRVEFGPGYRVYFDQDGRRLVILLVGGTKQRQQRGIAQAKAYWQDYKQRKKRRLSHAPEALGAELHKSPKSLMRMLSDEGNPRADNLFAVVAHLKAHEGSLSACTPR